MQMKNRDKLWMMSHAFYDDTPMWIGWNSRVTVDNLPQQSIGYMDNLSLPPTRLDVVAETMRISQKLAAECGEPYALVHYDIGVAKPALQIQAADSPTYDNVFVCPGAFHITMAYFAALGFFLADSGGPQILADTGVLASGSLNGFISGRHYNRCKRIHVLLALAIQMLHFKCFFAEHCPLPESFVKQLKKLQDDPSPDALKAFENSPEYVQVMQMYEEFTEKTRTGEHGTTAQYWIMYMDLVELHQLFSHATRTNDLDLFIYCLGEMCSMFFATNHPNYARYTVRYRLNLMNIESTHPGARETLLAGGLSVRRSSKAFTRTPVDLTLEQTVNADAASRMTGIAAFTQNLNARRRWMITHSIRSAILGYLFDMAGMRKKEDFTQELIHHHIARDNSDVEKIITGIKDTLNPFSGAAQDRNLYCLSTGKAASENVKTELLHCVETGKKKCQEFTDGCFANPARFEQPIPRQKVKNFSTDAVKVKITTKDKKIKELQGTQDLFGRLLYLAATNDLDLELVFNYPLTPVPLAIAHVDGSVNKTDKSKLMHKLEERVESGRPPSRDACAIDAMFLIQSLVDVPATFGGIAKVILARLLEFAPRVDFVCDSYKSPSIKDIEHSRRGSDGTHTEFIISGPEQKRTKDFNAALNSPTFKTALLQFFVKEWKRKAYVEQIRGHTLYVGLDEKAYKYEVKDGVVQREEIPTLA